MSLSKGFYARDVKEVARDLLGCFLCTKNSQGRVIRSIITETEAYDGEADLACHASKGMTERTSVMYEKGGVWYVYLCYGVHWMLNVVTGPEGYPAAVLIRGTEHFSGPGRLTKGLGVCGDLNRTQIEQSSALWIEYKICQPSRILSGPRIGVDYAGPEWSQKPYRFWFSN